MDKDFDISTLEFDRIDNVACYTKNNRTNKAMTALKREKIISSLFQLHENVYKVMKQLNAYDASSIIIAESNWAKRNRFNKYTPSQDAPHKVELGQICTVDYGKTYKGEIGYIHPALVVAKKNKKYLVIPMTTGKGWREKCYHPINNPIAAKHQRQSLVSEGFAKDGVLLLNDAKFISGGRILELHEIICDEALNEIKKQLHDIVFPNQYISIEEMNITKEELALTIEKNRKNNTTIINQRGRIKNLEKQCENLLSKVSYLEEQLKK